MAASKSVEHLFVEAQLLQQDNQASDAIEIYKKILEQNPSHTEALRYLALAYVQIGENQQAITTFQLALQINPDAILYMNLANVYKKINAVAEAIKYYKLALEINPKYAKAHNNLAGLYADLGDYNKALLSYKNALHADPSFTVAHLNLGILLFNNQEVVAANTQFNNVLAIDENNITALFYTGLIKLSENKLDIANKVFKEVLKYNSEHVESYVNLGVIALQQNKPQAAIDYFTKALAYDEENIEARNNLAATFIHNDWYENALRHYLVLIKQDPDNVEYIYNTGVAQMGLGHIDVATNLFNQALQKDPKHFGALSNLAAIKMRTNDRQGAMHLLQKARDVDPSNKTTNFMLQALSQNQKEIATCKEYARDLFNHYAMYYDKHMQDTLQYKIPETLWTLLHDLDNNEFNKILDLGCGTGLCGDVLQSFGDELTGVDISEKMLAIAESKGIYKQLIAQDILEFLEKAQAKYNLVVALDVLPYFGSLKELFAAVKNCLDVDGVFIFSTEISADSNWQVQESIRFSHSPEYISSLCDANNYSLLQKLQIPARKQDNLDLEEILYVCKLAKS